MMDLNVSEISHRKNTAAAFAAAVLFCMVVLLFSGCESTSAVPSAASVPERSVFSRENIAAVCVHPSWKNGVCTVCGTVCSHPLWEDGRCAVCGYACSHPSHNLDTACCSVCGLRVLHNYDEDGLCACGREAPALSGYLEPSLWEDCPEAGTVVTLDYPSHNYLDSGSVITKTLTAYLPFGYDSSGSVSYNIVILFHGSAGDENYWLIKPQQYDSEHEYSLKNLLDNLIYHGDIGPCIVICPTYLTPGQYWDSGIMVDTQQAAQELRNDILPFVVDTFPTFAADRTESSISSARDHFACVGASYGSLLTYSAGLELCFDLFGWYGALSGCSSSAVEMAAIISDSGLPLDGLYACAGERDELREDSEVAYYILTHTDTCVVDGKNAHFDIIPDAGHEYRVWDNGLVNALQQFFHT